MVARMDFGILFGRVNGEFRPVYKFGRNDDVDLAATEVVWGAGGLYNWRAAAGLIEVLSSDVDDTSAGSGARTLRVEGLDSDWAEISEDFVLNGTSAVAGSLSFLRVNRAYVLTTGTSHSANEGDITIRASGGGDTYGFVAAGAGQTQQAVYSIPADHSAVLMDLRLSVEDAKPAALAIYHQVDGGAPRIVDEFSVFQGNFFHDFRGYVCFKPKTDIWVTADAGSNDTFVSAAFSLILSKD